MEYTVMNGKDGAVLGRYNGIMPLRHMKDRPLPGGVPMLALAWFDGEADLWVLENRAAVAELVRYYADEGWEPGRAVVTLFTPADMGPLDGPTPTRRV